MRQSRLATAWRLALGAGVLLAALAVADPLPPDRIAVERRNDVLELTWADAEERLHGSLQPPTPRAGEPLKVFLHVGSFEGAPFEGPLTLSLRERGAPHGQSLTVRKQGVNWQAEFLPEREGPYQLDVSFRTTRHKLLHADFEVAPQPIPRFILWGVLGVAAVGLLIQGIRMLVRREYTPVPPAAADRPAEPSPSPTSTQVPLPAAAPLADPSVEAPAASEKSPDSASEKPPTL